LRDGCNDRRRLITNRALIEPRGDRERERKREKERERERREREREKKLTPATL
jgi:hypothetical protein